jgi:hypothetical protein
MVDLPWVEYSKKVENYLVRIGNTYETRKEYDQGVD